MNDDELKRKLDDLVPEPGPGYWERIDAMLEAVEAERDSTLPQRPVASPQPTMSPGRSETAEPARDTDDNVIRLTDMNETREDRFESAAGKRLMLVAAAVLVVLMAGGALFVATRGDNTAEVATEGQDDVEPTPSSLDSEVEAGAVEATYCYFDDDSELFVGEAGVRLVVYDSGAVTAVERFVAADGTDNQAGFTGYVLGRDEGLYSMSGPVGAAQSSTRVWIGDDAGLTTAEDSYLPAADCAEVDAFLSMVPVPDAAAPGTERVEPVLAAGRYCFVGNEPLFNAYELVVGPDGTVTSRAVSYQGPDLLIVALATGVGRFASPTEVVVEAEIWTPPQLASTTEVYTVVGDALQPTIYLDFLAVPTDCELFDRLGSKEHGFTIADNEDLAFAPGAGSATVKGGFIRGEADLYRVEASKGQVLTTTISSPEDNAAVSVYTPEGVLVSKNEDGFGSSSLVLPDDGVYEVLVSGIRGNVSYSLTVAID
jgi:hypothetical protein